MNVSGILLPVLAVRAAVTAKDAWTSALSCSPEAADSTPLSLEMKNGSSTSTTPTNVRGALAMKCCILSLEGEIHEKVMLSVWWGVHEIYRFELLPDNTTVTTEVYCAQLQRLADKIRKEHPKLDNVRLLHDSAPPHIAKKNSQKILELGWEVLPHPPYSPDLPPVTTTTSDRFSITWKRSARMIVTTSKMTFGVSSPPSHRSSTPKESVILCDVGRRLSMLMEIISSNNKMFSKSCVVSKFCRISADTFRTL
ncbi:hypothetical protein RB195_017258 [Necator americanus]|uniref:Transposase n=1 Tax=Necator americanus TaxID=51031 RepID=A0ABR1C4E5_NECAM